MNKVMFNYYYLHSNNVSCLLLCELRRDYGFRGVSFFTIEDEWVRSHDLCASQDVRDECDLQTISPFSFPAAEVGKKWRLAAANC